MKQACVQVRSTDAFNQGTAKRPFRFRTILAVAVSSLFIGACSDEIRPKSYTSRPMADAGYIAPPVIRPFDFSKYEKEMPKIPETSESRHASGENAGIRQGEKEFDEALASLKQSGFGKAAEVLKSRTIPVGPRPEAPSAQHIELAKQASLLIPEMKATAKLLEIMPCCAIELVASVAVRGVKIPEAEKIAEFLLKMHAEMKFRKLAELDVHHSYLIGREWKEIGHSLGIKQKKREKFWRKKGVENFRTAKANCIYFKNRAKNGGMNREYFPVWPFPKKLDSFCNGQPY